MLVNNQLDALFSKCIYFYKYIYTGNSSRPARQTVSHPLEYVVPDGVLIQTVPPDDEHLLLETCKGVK